MKKIFPLIFAAFCICSLLVSCSKKNLDEKEITLVMSEVNPADSIVGKVDFAFKSKVEELSKGKIKIDLQCSGIFGDADSILTSMTKNESSIDILRTSIQNMASFGCTDTSLLTIPYTFSGREHFWRFAYSGVAKNLLEEPLKKGMNVKGLFFAEEGFRHFFSSKPIKAPEDFKGRNVRGTNDKPMQELLSDLGANSVYVTYIDLYSALQIGKVDIADQPIANYLTNHFNEVAPYMILDGHVLGVTETIISMKVWESLSENQKNILMEAGKYAQDYCHELLLSEESKIRTELENQGATVSDVDVKVWQKAASRVIDDCSVSNPELYKAVLSFAE